VESAQQQEQAVDKNSKESDNRQLTEWKVGDSETTPQIKLDKQRWSGATKKNR
jgi:glutaredoxin